MRDWEVGIRNSVFGEAEDNRRGLAAGAAVVIDEEVLVLCMVPYFFNGGRDDSAFELFVGGVWIEPHLLA